MLRYLWEGTYHKRLAREDGEPLGTFIDPWKREVRPGVQEEYIHLTNGWRSQKFCYMQEWNEQILNGSRRIRSTIVAIRAQLKKKEVWLSPMTKAITPTEKSKTKNFDYTTIADRLKTVSWSNSGQPNWCA